MPAETTTPRPKAPKTDATRAASETLLTRLERLGDTPDAVAASLLALDCKGRPGNAGACPVARFARVVMADVGGPFAATECEVSAFRRVVVRPENVDDRETINVPAPAAVRAFIHAFDSDQYPALLAPSLLGAVTRESDPCLACGARGIYQSEDSGQWHCIACAYVHLPAKYLARRATPTGERTA